MLQFSKYSNLYLGYIICYADLIYNSLSYATKVGILTVSSKLVTHWDNMLLKECEDSGSISILISVISESEYCEILWSQLNGGFDKRKVEEAIVKVAL